MPILLTGMTKIPTYKEKDLSLSVGGEIRMLEEAMRTNELGKIGDIYLQSSPLSQ